MEELVKYLKKSDLNYTRGKNSCVINLPNKLCIMVKFIDSDRVVISNKILSFNLLTGLLEMTLNNAIKYNSIGLIIFGFYSLMSEALNLSYVLPIEFVLVMTVVIIINILNYLFQFYYYKFKITSILNCL